jgi:beta-xylosidase
VIGLNACDKAPLQDKDSNSVWIPDNGDGTYHNPVIFADYSDPDVVQVGNDFYMVASSFNCSPGMPVLHSKDLVNWKIIGHVFEKQQPDSIFNIPQHGKGCWAPSIRYHDGYFWIYYGDPDFGIYMTKSQNPGGPWDPLHLVKNANGA